MFRSNFTKAGAIIAAFGLTTLAIACGDKDLTFNNVVVLPTNTFTQTNLVSDVATYGGTTLDPQLINSWGIVFDAAGAMWVANAGSGTVTSYDANGAKLTPTITIPPAGSPVVNPTGTPLLGKPTGIVLNTTTDFGIPGQVGPASYIFAGEDGAISAWNASMGTNAQIVNDQSPNAAVYKGLAMAVNGTANRLYATNFAGGKVDVFDGLFALVASFTDSTAPAGYAPFGVANIGGNLYVTFALKDANGEAVKGAGNGFVDVFTPAGALVRRFASNGTLNAPWAVAVATANFGPFAGNILVGNFGDGMISAFDATTGNLVDVMRDINGTAIAIPGLWGFTFGPAAGANTLYFASGPGDELHGLVGRLAPR